jgi:hypothetical protein
MCGLTFCTRTKINEKSKERERERERGRGDHGFLDPQLWKSTSVNLVRQELVVLLQGGAPARETARLVALLDVDPLALFLDLAFALALTLCWHC